MVQVRVHRRADHGRVLGDKPQQVLEGVEGLAVVADGGLGCRQQRLNHSTECPQ